MSCVLDASLTLSWFFEDERTPEADVQLDWIAEHGAIVPDLWRLEVANGFQMAIRRGRLSASYRGSALEKLARLPIDVDSETDLHAWSTSLALADRFQLTLYDAAYLELAQRRHLPLATLDRSLRSAATRLALHILGATKL